jgi:hypothetical protein
MTARSSESEVDTLVTQYAPDIQVLSAAARGTLAAAFPGAEETADEKARLIGYAYGSGYEGTVATLILSKAGVKIGIPYGAGLVDPAKLLAGAGNVHRHVAIATPDQLRAPALKALLRAAYGAWQVRTDAVQRTWLPSKRRVRAPGGGGMVFLRSPGPSLVPVPRRLSRECCLTR